MRSLALLLVLIPTVASASDCCFVQKRVYRSNTYQKAVVNKPQIINQIVPLQPSQDPKIDVEGIIAEGRALEMALQAIPGIDRDLQAPQWRCFRFNQNVSAYRAPAAAQQQQTVATQRVVRKYVGVVDTSFRIKADGTVDFQVDGEQKQQQGQQQPQQSYGGYGY